MEADERLVRWASSVFGTRRNIPVPRAELPWFDGSQARLAAAYELAGPTPLGRRLVARGLRRAAVVRQRVSDAPIEFPRVLFVTGLPRSGTTALHRALALGLEVEYFSFRDTLRPLGRGPVWGRELAVARALWPEAEDLHPLSIDAPEECWPLLCCAGLWLTLDLHLGLKGYGDWLLSHELDEPLGTYARLVAQVARGRDPLVLKAPEHLAWLPALSRVLPTARFVRIHRPLEDCARSYAGLVRGTRRALLAEPSDPAPHIERRFWELDRRGQGARAVLGERLLEVEGAELRTRPEDVVDRIAAWSGLSRAHSKS